MAELIFLESAYRKMRALVEEFSGEVGWHGTVNRLGEGRYLVTDIIVYPQTVTGVTVTTDQGEYNQWLMSQPDEIFNNLRLQGHSHVRMSVSPSGVDEALYSSLLSQLEGDMFYVVMITNKRHEYMVRIYDLQVGGVFEEAKVSVESDVFKIAEFLDDARGLVKDSHPHMLTMVSDFLEERWR